MARTRRVAVDFAGAKSTARALNTTVSNCAALSIQSNN